MANAIDVSNAYVNTLKQAQGLQSKQDAGAAGSASFGDLLKGAAQSAIDAQHKSEQVSGAAIMGNANMTDVLQAVNDAEIALNTVLAVRDRVVQAYEQIMRTPI